MSDNHHKRSSGSLRRHNSEYSSAHRHSAPVDRSSPNSPTDCEVDYSDADDSDSDVYDSSDDPDEEARAAISALLFFLPPIIVAADRREFMTRVKHMTEIRRLARPYLRVQPSDTEDEEVQQVRALLSVVDPMIDATVGTLKERRRNLEIRIRNLEARMEAELGAKTGAVTETVTAAEAGTETETVSAAETGMKTETETAAETETGREYRPQGREYRDRGSAYGRLEGDYRDEDGQEDDEDELYDPYEGQPNPDHPM
ncbi:hypothetical protein EDC01DRAFT_628246 [Geopyxis carbonaria]|nr:hypothetical protein EDC01DRAFT_628246 [Geopyxis carbonaria]